MTESEAQIDSLFQQAVAMHQQGQCAYIDQGLQLCLCRKPGCPRIDTEQAEQAEDQIKDRSAQKQ